MSTIKSSAENLTLNADGSGNDVLIQSNASTKAIFNAEGSVGIGTTSISIPSGTALEVYDAVVPRIKLANSTTGNASSDGFDMHIDGSTKDVKLFQRESANIILATNSAERVRVQSDGKVGLSTTSPAALLSLGQDSGSGDSAASSGIAFKTSNNEDMFQISTVGGGNAAARGLKFSVDGTEKMRMSGAGIVTMPSQPAFAAQLASTQSNIATNSAVTVLFASETFDQNSDFNTSTYTFTAPVTGKYQFNIIIRLDNMDTAATYYQMYFRTSNRDYYAIIAPKFASDPQYYSMATPVLADMDANDTAYVIIYAGGGAAQMDIAQTADSHFSGYLVC